MWRYGDPDTDLKSLVLRSKTPRASGGLELLSFEPGEPEVEPGDGAGGTPLGLDRSDSSRSMTSLDDEAERMDSRLLTLAAQVESNREVGGLERSSLWELVKAFMHRGLECVFCELVDETGSMRSGMCHIDVRLSSELVEDNVGRRASMSSRWVQMSTAQGSMWSTMSGSESALSPGSPGRRQVVRSGLR